MDIGVVGLGRMGLLVVQRLTRKHHVVTFDVNPEATRKARKLGASVAKSTVDLVEQLPKRKIVWLMLPAGKPVEDTVKVLAKILPKGAVVIDGGNSYWKDSKRREAMLARKGIAFVDCGTSGGIRGGTQGFSLMIGGEKKAVRLLTPVFSSIAARNGFGYVGPSGSGHFVKMVHNGIEYGLLQSYGEGLDVLQRSPYRLKLEQVAHIWNHGAIVRSWLTELLEEALREDPRLKRVPGKVGGGETGKWALTAAQELGVATPALRASYQARLQTRKKNTFAGKVVAVLRNKFGGHSVTP